MAHAKQEGVSTIAFPLLSAGLFRGHRSLGQVLAIGMEAIEESSYSGLEEVYMVAFSHDESDVLKQLFAGIPVDQLNDPSATPDHVVPVMATATVTTTATATSFSDFDPGIDPSLIH
mmetsp:Transcript_32395/g.85119  ORF Transcript_32395/g.85119 Transcript_32395/m.85119 type:complete len:117 (-) Transcript_32395:47-397(-)